MRRTLALGAVSMMTCVSGCIGPAFTYVLADDGGATDATVGAPDAAQGDASSADAPRPGDSASPRDGALTTDGSLGDASVPPDATVPLDSGNADSAGGGDGNVPSDGGPCTGGFISCNGSCVDPSSLSNCGGCGNQCASDVPNGASCTLVSPGQYACGCTAGFSMCRSVCYSIDASPELDPCIADQSAATYVAPWGTNGGGLTEAAPALTIQEGISAAIGHTRGRVYVCGGQYAGAISASSYTSAATLALYGGFTCPQGGAWFYSPDAGIATVAPTAPGLALSVISPNAGLNLLFRDFVFQAGPVPTAAATGNGASSIAASVFGGLLTFQNVSFVASDAQAGGGVLGPVSEILPPPVVGGTASGSGNLGAAGGAIAKCPGGDSTNGGAGGAGGLNGGGAGGEGVPLLGPNGGSSAFLSCTAGTSGLSGQPGGPGIAALAYGGFADGGWYGSPGGNGGYGTAGQGGGGGAGGAAVAGAGGGGGGSGGCGGLGGNGGGGGGGSIGLIVLGDASVTLSGCSFTTGNGGNGGEGSVGLAGGTGAAGGSHADGGAGCGGGGGGTGGTGGPSAGGTGGLSVGVLIQDGGGASVVISDAGFSLGQPGSPGLGADGAPTGTSGLSAPVVAL